MTNEADKSMCLGGYEEQGWSLVEYDKGYFELYTPSGYVFNSETELQVADINDPDISEGMKEILRLEEVHADVIFNCLKRLTNK